MIEFKGDCGHLIRARAEDVGKVVRCSYCGKEAVVVRPGSSGDPEENLLDAVEQTGVFDAEATKAQRRSHRERKRAEKRLAAGKPAAVDPFAVILKMTYVAVIVVIAAVGFKYVPGLYKSLAGQAQSSPSPSPESGGHTETQATTHKPTPPPVVASGRKGLLTERLEIHPDGAYISTVPGDAMIFHVARWNALSDLFTKEESRSTERTNAILKLNSGRHTIGVAVRINDPELMRLPGYKDLRRALEDSFDDDDASKRISAYFLPDDAVAQRLVRVDRYLYIARAYEVEVKGTWVAVTALFVPREAPSALLSYLPSRTTFGFERADVERELRFYEVPDADCRAVLDALERVGRMSYRKSESDRYRLFQIDPMDGAITSVPLNR